jgi:aminoglycoside phosphotransferase (APT) family kinase protein
MVSEPVLGRALGSGKEAEVFEYGKMVLKLYRPEIPKRSAFREAAILSIIEPFELPTPRAEGVRRMANRWGVTMTRAEGITFADGLRLQPQRMPEYLKEMARLQSDVHRHPGTLFPGLKARLAANIENATVLTDNCRRLLLSRLAEMPDGDRLCHGDFHPFNIVGPLEAGMIIDWLNASCGEPAADVCRSYVLIRTMDPDMASAYVDAYAAMSGEARSRVFSWLPFVAAARLAEGVPGETESLVAMADGITEEAGL